MSDDTTVTDPDVDPDLDRQIRAHFELSRQHLPVPAFEAVMASAEAGRVEAIPAPASGWLRSLMARRRSIAGWAGWAGWAGIAAATGVMALHVLVQSDRPALPVLNELQLAGLPPALSISQQELITDLNSSTRWQAPSDSWPVTKPDVDVLGLPILGYPADDSQEKQTWL